MILKDSLFLSLLKTNVNIKNWSTKEITKYYQAAHCFHIFKKDLLFKKDIMLDKDHGCFEIDDDETLDVDTPEDFEFAKWILKNER